MSTDAKERALLALDVPGYLGLNLFENFRYRLMKIIFYRREDRFARRLIENMENIMPLDDFSRGTLLGHVHAWDMPEDISPQMNALLQIIIQDSKYHEDKI